MSSFEKLEDTESVQNADSLERVSVLKVSLRLGIAKMNNGKSISFEKFSHNFLKGFLNEYCG